MRLGKGIFVLAALFFLAPGAWAKIDTVKVQDFSFVPASLVINRGDSVVWKVTLECCSPHTTTRMGLYSWDSGPLPLNGTYLVAFRDAGRFDYVCSTHFGIGMVGSVTVLSKAPSMTWLGLTLLLASLGVAAIWILERRRKMA